MQGEIAKKKAKMGQGRKTYFAKLSYKASRGTAKKISSSLAVLQHNPVQYKRYPYLSVVSSTSLLWSIGAPVMAMSEHARNISCAPQPRVPVPFEHTPQLLPQVYVHCNEKGYRLNGGGVYLGMGVQKG